MNKKIVQTLMVSILISGCTSFTYSLSNVYNDAIASGKNKTIVKDGDFSSIKENVNSHLKDIGYSKVFYSNPQEGYMVLVKDVPLSKALLTGNAYPYKIILKYTKAGIGKTRIDFVNGSPGLFSKEEVEQDILKVVNSIGVY